MIWTLKSLYHTKLLLSVSLALVLHSGIFAQEMWGVVSGNYAGSNGAIINPASLTTSKLYMDINIIAADVFVENNYLYIHAEDYSFGEFLKKDPQFPSYGPDKMAFDFYRDKDLKQAYVNVMFRGPSFFQMRRKHAYAVSTSVRVLTSAKYLPHDVANIGYNGLDYEPQYNINYDNYDFYGNSMAFGEIGITYAYIIQQYGLDEFSVGATVKGLFSYSGAYAYVENMDYILLNDSSVNVKNLNAEVGYSLPLDYETGDFPESNTLVRGTGMGIDLGFTYERKTDIYKKSKSKKLCQQQYIDYRYRIGFSIIDLGFVRFGKNAEKHAFEDVNRYWINIDTLEYQNMDQLTGDLSRVFYGDPDASYRDDKISIFLPTAFSFQFDYHLQDNWYINSTVIQPLVISKSSITRPSQLVVSPRYESPRVEFSMPVSLYEWRYPRMGFAVRWEVLTIGTDNLGGFFGFSDFTGMDIYFAIKINFAKGNCGRAARFTGCGNEEYGRRKR